MGDDKDKVVSKKGNVFSVTEINEIRRKDREKKTRLRHNLRNDYMKYRMEGLTDTEARGEIKKNRGISDKVLNYALNAGDMNAKAAAEWSAKALVLQQREEQALDDFIDFLDGQIMEVLDSEPAASFPVQIEDSQRGTVVKLIPRNEYLFKLMQDKRRAIKETIDSLKVFRKQDTTVNIAIDASEREARMKSGLERFNVEVE